MATCQTCGGSGVVSDTAITPEEQKNKILRDKLGEQNQLKPSHELGMAQLDKYHKEQKEQWFSTPLPGNEGLTNEQIKAGGEWRKNNPAPYDNPFVITRQPGEKPEQLPFTEPGPTHGGWSDEQQALAGSGKPGDPMLPGKPFPGKPGYPGQPITQPGFPSPKPPQIGKPRDPRFEGIQSRFVGGYNPETGKWTIPSHQDAIGDMTSPAREVSEEEYNKWIKGRKDRFGEIGDQYKQPGFPGLKPPGQFPGQQPGAPRPIGLGPRSDITKINEELASKGYGRIEIRPGIDWTTGQSFTYYIDPQGNRHNLSGSSAGWMGVGENKQPIPKIPGITVPDESGWQINQNIQTSRPVPGQKPGIPQPIIADPKPILPIGDPTFPGKPISRPISRPRGTPRGIPRPPQQSSPIQSSPIIEARPTTPTVTPNIASTLQSRKAESFGNQTTPQMNAKRETVRKRISRLTGRGSY